MRFNVTLGLAREYGLALRVRSEVYRAQVRQLLLPAVGEGVILLLQDV